MTFLDLAPLRLRPLLAFLAPVLFALAWAGTAEAVPSFKILVEEDGVYRVDFEALAAAGLAEGVPSSRLAVSSHGSPVPIWIEDGGDGVFGPGDHFELVGRRLVGEKSWVHDYAWHNVYWLRLEEGGARMRPVEDGAEPAAEAARPRLRRHLEEDSMLVRLPGRLEQDDSWFGAKMVHNQTAPTPVPLELPGLDPEGFVSVELEVRGWSRPHNKASAEVADHRLVVKVADSGSGEERTLAAESWNGGDAHRFVLEDLPAAWFVGESPELRLRVPVRRETSDERPLIDVIMLNWVEVAYDHDRAVEAAGQRLEWTAGSSFELAEGAAEDLVAYGADGSRTPVSDGRVRVAPSELSAWVVGKASLRPAPAVVADAPSELLSTARQADYLMVVHHAFREALEPLAELHRRRGLEVAVIEVEDIYDELNHGIAHPRAIRDFISNAYHRWQAPAPRFVLLVGDASWDVKNAEAVDEHYADWTYRRGESRDFLKNTSTPYDGATGRQRHFIPAWQTTTSQGHAASDNFFVDVEGEDGIPELAIGRLPVASPDEVRSIVRKVESYVEPAPGPWREGVLFVTNEEPRYQNHSDRLAAQVEEAGYSPLKIYPASTEKSNEENTRGLIEALGRGQLLVHFIGHGGRYIWRTGPPDLEKNHDLFTLEDLDQLPPSNRLPVIVSLTCYSAPFDHPTADSIGEKFLRVDGRGAIGVIAASWRNSPSVQWGSVLLEELTAPGATVGEALMHSKRRVRSPMFRETYLLLGDPAVPVALPGDSEPPATSVADAASGAAGPADSPVDGPADSPGVEPEGGER